MKVVVSACLLGENCKYNGGNNFSPAIMEVLKNKDVIPVCPELLAGLGVPRAPIEIIGDDIRTRDGKSVAAALNKAVAAIIEQLAGEDIEYAILKSRSPTCGVKQVYDGTFSGELVDGMGVLSAALKENGYRVIDSEDFVCK